MLLINDRATLLKSATLKSSRPYSPPAIEKRRVELPREIVPATPAPKPAKLRHVALLIETSGSYGRGMLQGIAKYNRERANWSTYFRPHGLNEPLPRWLSTWATVHSEAPDRAVRSFSVRAAAYAARSSWPLRSAAITWSARLVMVGV